MVTYFENLSRQGGVHARQPDNRRLISLAEVTGTEIDVVALYFTTMHYNKQQTRQKSIGWTLCSHAVFCPIDLLF
jgi:hypothetical protein